MTYVLITQKTIAATRPVEAKPIALLEPFSDKNLGTELTSFSWTGLLTATAAQTPATRANI